MKTRQLGTNGPLLTEIGLGAWAIGGAWGTVDDKESMAALHQAIDCGVNFIDTAEIYSIPPRPETQGSTERIIGSWLAARRNRDKVVIATNEAVWVTHLSETAAQAAEKFPLYVTATVDFAAVPLQISIALEKAGIDRDEPFKVSRFTVTRYH